MTHRLVIQISTPVEVLGVVVDGHVAHGHDHVLGYFFEGYDARGDKILDRDQSGCGCVLSCPNSDVPLTHAEYETALDVVLA